MSNSLVSFSVSRPVWVYWIILIVTLVTAGLIINIKIDTDPENMLPEDSTARIYHNQIKKEFQLDDIIVVGAVAQNHTSIYNPSSLKDLKLLTNAVLTIDGVQSRDVNGLTTIDNIEQDESGNIRFEWMMASPPENQLQADSIQRKASRLPLVVNSLVSADEKAATLYIPIADKNESYRIAQQITEIVSSLSDANDYHITGLPVAEDTFGFEMFVQMGISAPTAAVVIYLLMLYFFRSAKLVIAPMIVAMSTVIIIMGVMIGMGYTVHIMSSMIAIFLMPIAVVDSVHLMSEFVDSYRKEKCAKEVIAKVTNHLFKPMLFTSITSAAGFFSLTLTPIPPVQIFGIFVGSGILLAFLLTIVFIPAYVSRMTESQLHKMQIKLYQGEKSKSIIARVLPAWGIFSISRHKLILAISFLIVIFSAVGISKIEINDNPVRWFKAEHPIRVADRVLNQHFAGTYDAHLVFEFTEKNKLIGEWEKEISDLLMKLSLSESERTKIQNFMINYNDVDPFQDFLIMIDDLLFDVSPENELEMQRLINITENYSLKSRFFMHPEILSYIESMQVYLLSTGKVGKSNSMVDFVKTVNRELYSGAEDDYKIPLTAKGVSQTLLQFQSSHRPQDLWHFVTPDYSKALLWLQMNSGDNKDMSAVIAEVNHFISQSPLPEGVTVNWAGKAYLNLVWQDQMVSGMFESLTSAFVIVFIMMTLLFRSVIFGFLAMLPLSITILFMYGMIGWSGKYYDMPIAVLSALTLGLSVDFAIHFIERTKTIYSMTNDWQQTISQMFNEPARAITRNALVIAFGFTPLLLAPLVPYITVGVFLAAIMVISALVTILLLPASMEIMKNYLFNLKKEG